MGDWKYKLEKDTFFSVVFVLIKGKKFFHNSKSFLWYYNRYWLHHYFASSNIHIDSSSYIMELFLNDNYITPKVLKIPGVKHPAFCPYGRVGFIHIRRDFKFFDILESYRAFLISILKTICWSNIQLDISLSLIFDRPLNTRKMS